MIDEKEAETLPQYTDIEISDTSRALEWAEPPPDTSEERKHSTQALRRRQMAFLGAYCTSGSIGRSAKSAGVSIATASRWRKNDIWFKERFQESELVYNDVIHDAIHTRAVDGFEVPVIGKVMNAQEILEDKVIGYKTVYSDRMLALLAGRHDPRYRDNFVEPPMADSLINGEVTVLARMVHKLDGIAERRVVDKTPEDKESTE